MKKLTSLLITLTITLLLTTLSCNSANLVVTWKPIVNAEEYSVSYGTEALTVTRIIKETKYIIENVSPGWTYFVIVKAIDKDKNLSEESKVIRIKIPGKEPNKQLKRPKVEVSLEP